MKFENLYKNLLTMTESERLEFFIGYTQQRAFDIANSAVIKESTKQEKSENKAISRGKKVSLSTEQYELLKKLGLV